MGFWTLYFGIEGGGEVTVVTAGNPIKQQLLNIVLDQMTTASLIPGTMRSPTQDAVRELDWTDVGITNGVTVRFSVDDQPYGRGTNEEELHWYNIYIVATRANRVKTGQEDQNVRLLFQNIRRYYHNRRRASVISETNVMEFLSEVRRGPRAPREYGRKRVEDRVIDSITIAMGMHEPRTAVVVATPSNALTDQTPDGLTDQLGLFIEGVS